MNPRFVTLAASLVLASCGDKASQEDTISVQNGSGGVAVPAGPAPAEVRGQAFVSAVIGTYQFEIESARLVAAKAGRADVKAFAQGLTADIERSLTSLNETARAGGIETKPTAGVTHQSDLAILSSTRGAPLEQAYIDQQLLALTDLLGLVRAYKNGGDNSRLKEWANTAQAMIADQLDKMQSLKAMVEEAAEASAGS